VASQTWHPDQRQRTDSDGAYILEVPYANDRELVMEILKLGVDVQVLAPPALCSRVSEILKAAAEVYQIAVYKILCIM